MFNIYFLTDMKYMPADVGSSGLNKSTKVSKLTSLPHQTSLLLMS